MQEYEIRVLKLDHTQSLILSEFHFSDEAAIRFAKKIAADRPVEVWRALACILNASNTLESVSATHPGSLLPA